jgi:hypothetical protein
LESSNFPFTDLQNFTGTNDATASGFHCWHFVEDEDLIVWMKTSMDSDFWRLHRIIRNGLKKGTYQLNINLNYPVAGFDGTKGIVLTNATPFGGKRSALAVVYLVVGSFSLLFGIIAFLLGWTKVVKPEVHYPPEKIPDNPPTGTKVASPSCAIGSLGAAPVRARSDRQRVIAFPSADPGARKFLTNFVSTTKYTLITFVPKSLYLQFQLFANVYFLIIAILATIPQISPLSPSTFWVPLLQQLIMSAMGEAKDDYNRYLSDVEENSRTTQVSSHQEPLESDMPTCNHLFL